MIDYSVADALCVLRLNAPPVNAVTFELLQALQDAVRRANDDAAVQWIAIVGDEKHFSAGADVNIFRAITTGDAAIGTSRVFQDAFQVVEDSARPVAAAVAGKVMGSALELPLACHFRVCTKDAKFSMPEVNLGINPGAGGTQRLPRLVGADAALRMLLTGESVTAEDALDMGLVDAVCEGQELVPCAQGLLESGAAPRRTGERTDMVANAEDNAAAFAAADKLLAQARPEIVAPGKIADAVRVGIEESFASGLRREQAAFAECMATLATQNKIRLFFATRDTSKVPGLETAKPASVARAAVVGMGSMGAGIAHALIIAGVPVVVLDRDPEAVRKGMDRIAGSVHKRVRDGKMTQKRADGMIELLAEATDWQALAGVNLVIEAVFEDVEVKRSVIAEIEHACPGDTLIASNTSTISLDALAEGMQHPERLIGMHFFNPAHVMPLVEIIRRDTTPPDPIATGLKFAKAIRKTPVLVRNREGFLVNRIFIPYLKEAFWLLEDGASAADVDAAMVAFGFPMGPLALIDMAGIDILAHTDAVMAQAFPHHGRLSPIAVRLVQQGRVGQKAGSGVYKYEPSRYTPLPCEATEALIRDVQSEKGLDPGHVSTEEITQRLVLRMVAEAFCVVEEGVAQRESDVDAAMVLGTGFPDFRGGVLKYARDLGLARVVAQLDQFTERHGDRFAACDTLRAMC